MKKIYKSLLAFAAALVLVPTAYAQEPNREIYEFDEVKGIGYNKYLLSTTPNSDGEYTLRIENFITGQVKQNAIPTDFVIVLDASGSMKYDYRPNQLYPPMNDGVNAQTWAALWPYFYHETGHEYTAFTIQYTYKTGTVGNTTSGNVASATNRVATRSYYTHFRDEGANASCSMFYHYVDGTGNDGYYKIFRRMFDASDGHLLVGPENPGADSGWSKYASENYSGKATSIAKKPATVYYNLAIRLKDGTYKYLKGNGLSDTRYDATATNLVMFTNNGNIYMLQRRGEALTDGVEKFVKLVATENAKDQWADNIPAKHQIAIVRFSGNYPKTGASITPITGYSTDTHVMFGFTEINGTSEAETFINNFEDKYIITGSTYTDYGMHLAMMLLQNLQTKDGGIYAALNAGGGVVRNKVVVFFTDGEPSGSKHADSTAEKDTFFGTVTPTLRDGKTVKQVGIGKINGRIYSIDLSMSSSTKDFLKHLSSNYPKGDANVLTGNYSAANLTGIEVPIPAEQVGEGAGYEFTPAEYKYLKDEEPNYYKDSSNGDLSSVFESIAAANTGALSGTLLAVDTMSDSFVMPENVNDPGKVKIYTAQCIGTKTFTVNGEEKEFLAFAEPIQIKDRPSLDHLWCVREVDQPGGGKKAEWVDIAGDYGIDIDSKIDFTTTTDGKKISVSGFQYSDLWCGLDPDPDHNNTRQIESSDPNYGFQKDGYRGFKLIFDFPIKIDPDALGGVNVPTNDWANSGLYKSGETEPEVHYPEPDLPVPVKLVVQKTGLKPGESANFTVQRKHRTEAGATYEDLLTFVITGDEAKTPEVRIINLDPAYYYKVKEENWSWAYTNVHPEYSTETPGAKNPIVFENTPKDDTPKHAEAKADNTLKSW